MLQVKNIHKEYRTGPLVQKALDDVSLNLRDNEFVSILGPSGSGKTTLLNIIGGLDRYDDGDLIINGISTRKYKDRDWDSYRNHTIGFVFQSYNLIPHQTILSNVELALTISGITKSERREKSIRALEKVGLIDHIHKKPNQLSGGQMQRVAIARALVNDPDILLADEPTGALDSDTSVQVMDLLKEVAKDRLVVMVTHNPELAYEYSTRIVTLKDGKICGDTNPFIIEDNGNLDEAVHENMGKTSMSFLTSLSLSFNNLKTKKGRTFLTAFAGSIGIIGIALILSLSNGVNNYIADIEEKTLSEYPLQIQKAGYDFTSMLTGMSGASSDSKNKNEKKDMKVENMVSGMFSTVGSNDLKSLKKFLDSDKSKIAKHTNAVEYSYDVVPQIYSTNTEKVRQVHPDKSFNSMGLGSEASSNSMVSSMMSTDIFYQMPRNKSLYRNQYEVKAGKWPTKYNECVLVLTADGGISDYYLYALNLRDPEELDDMVDKFAKEEEVIVPEGESGYSYKDVLGKEFKLVNATDYYEYDSKYNVWKDKRNNDEYMKKLVKEGETLKITGIVQPKKGSSGMEMLMPAIYYTPELEDHVIKQASESQIVKKQLADKDTNVFTGKGFEDTSKSAFDMKSMFNVDTSKFASAFSINPNRMNVDFSNLNNLFGQINMPSIKPSDIINQINIKITPEQINSLINDVGNGYLIYLKENKDMDFTKYQGIIESYFKDPELEKMVTEMIEEAIKTNGEIKLTQEQMNKILQAAIEKYKKFITDNNVADVMKIGRYFLEYLNTADCKNIIGSHLDTISKENNLEQQIYAVLQKYMGSATGSISATIEREITASMRKLSQSMANAFSFDASVFADAMNVNMSEEEMMEIMTASMYKEQDTFDNNIKKLGYAEMDDPSMISIYPKDFEEKEKVVDILDNYNEDMEKVDEDKVISYTDMVGSLMSSVTSIINSISYILVAFVAISLVVSSIMIGVITYISVLERKKEIGVLRAIGASKRNISQVFNAETFIIGALAGIIGIVVSLILIVPINQVIHNVTGKTNMNAALPLWAGIVLIMISIVLTLLGGIIPSRKAAKEDPVKALRNE